LHLERLEDRTLMSVDVGLTFPGIPATSYTLPDTIAAAGYNYVVEGVNLTLRYYDYYSGTPLFTTTFQSFFAPLGGVQQMSDPVVSFDEYTGQFLVGVIEYNSSGSIARFDFAVSNDYSPFDGWQLARYDMHDSPNTLNDYPRFGYNADAYFVSFNMFTPSFSHVDVLTISKADLTGYRVQVPGGSANFTLAPATIHQGNPGDPEWFVETGTPTTLKVVRMDNVLSDTPTFTFYNVSVSAYSNPPAAVQEGTSFKITANDDRILNVAMWGGLLVADHAVGSGGVAHARWYMILVGDFGAVPYQEGEIDPGPGVYTFFPAIEINYYEGDIGLTYMESSSNEYLSMYVTGENINDPIDTMQTPQLVFAGTGPYLSSRAGDYSGITVDPNDGYGFWAASEYKDTSTWNTGIANFGVSPAPGDLGLRGGVGHVGIFTLPNQATPVAGNAAPATTSASATTSAATDHRAMVADWLLAAAQPKEADTVAMGLRQDAVPPVEVTDLALIDQDNVWNGTNL
jgi:hypothetical protein